MGHVGLGMFGGRVGTVKRQTYDGDTVTVTVRALGNFGIRFLGIDTPEKKIPLPGEETFTSLSDPRWEMYLASLFSSDEPAYSAGLTAHLKGLTGGGAASNHKRIADEAEDTLEELIQNDLAEMAVAREDFVFYLRFAFEIMDGYGRLLCFINRDQPDAGVPSPRPKSYNDRMLEAGMASPYFIWPNINPWRTHGSITDAVFAPGTANDIAVSDSKLREAREAVKRARAHEKGIFASPDPLRIEPFEIRYLSKRATPSRWIIDLSRNDGILIHPENYFTIPHAEDRLFVSAHHVPLFVEAGWRKQAAP